MYQILDGVIWQLVLGAGVMVAAATGWPPILFPKPKTQLSEQTLALEPMLTVRPENSTYLPGRFGQ